jgi:predicted rRNA methylase YqxC with S4 and FtsJ domains
LLVALGLAESRARAQALILAGKVFSDTNGWRKRAICWPMARRLKYAARTTSGFRSGAFPALIRSRATHQSFD